MSLKDLFTSLLCRQPTETELHCHKTSPLSFYDKRNEFLNCEEFKNIPRLKPQRIALLISGQVRNFELCFASLYEHLLSCNNGIILDVFVCTQDCESIKPREGSFNQYFIFPLDKETLDKAIRSKFGDLLKGFEIRETYQDLIHNQKKNMQLSTGLGWAESFLDLSKCIKMAQAYEKDKSCSYDVFYRLRVDLIFCQPIVLERIPKNTCVKSITDVYFYFDGEAALKLKDFYNYYLLKWKTETDFIAREPENVLNDFLQKNGVGIIHDTWARSFPIGWIIMNVKLGISGRVELFTSKWQNIIKNYVDGLQTIYFDVEPANMYLY